MFFSRLQLAHFVHPENNILSIGKVHGFPAQVQEQTGVLVLVSLSNDKRADRFSLVVNLPPDSRTNHEADGRTDKPQTNDDVRFQISFVIE